MGDVLSCLDDREEEKVATAGQKPQVVQRPATQPQPGSKFSANSPRLSEQAKNVSWREESASPVKQQPPADNGGGQQAASVDARAQEAAKKRLREAIRSDIIDILDEAIRQGRYVKLSQEDLQPAIDAKRKLAAKVTERKAAPKPPATAPAAANGANGGGTTPAPARPVPKPLAAEPAKVAKAAAAPRLGAPGQPQGMEAQEAARELLREAVASRRSQEISDAIVSAEAAGLRAPGEPMLRKAKEIRDADNKRKEIARQRREASLAEDGGSSVSGVSAPTSPAAPTTPASTTPLAKRAAANKAAPSPPASAPTLQPSTSASSLGSQGKSRTAQRAEQRLAVIDKLEQAIETRKMQDIAEGLAEAERLGMTEAETATLTRARELREADARRREKARLRRGSGEAAPPGSSSTLSPAGSATVLSQPASPTKTVPATAPAGLGGSAAADVLEKLQQALELRRVADLPDLIREAEQLGVPQNQEVLRQAKQMKEVDEKRKKAQAARRASERAAA